MCLIYPARGELEDLGQEEHHAGIFHSMCMHTNTGLCLFFNPAFPDSTRRGDVEAGKQQSDSSSTSFYTF